MLVWGPAGGVVAVSTYMGGSSVFSNASDMLEMSVVRGVGGVCGMWLGREVLGVNG